MPVRRDTAVPDRPKAAAPEPFPGLEKAPEGEQPIAFQDDFGTFPGGPGMVGGPRSDAPLQPLVIVTGKKPLDRTRLVRGLLAQQGPVEKRPMIVFLSDRSIMIGHFEPLVRYLNQVAQTTRQAIMPQPGLERALEHAAKGHLVCAGAAPSEQLLQNVLALDADPDAAAARLTLYPLATIEAAIATMDLGKNLEVNLKLIARSERHADLVAQAVKTGVATIAVTTEETLKILDQLKEDQGKAGLHPLSLVRRALDSIKVTTADDVVSVQLQMNVPNEILQHLAAEVVEKLRSAGDRERSINHLKQLALAMHNYHDVNRAFPPAGLRDIKGGKAPLLSWRVALLPYLEQQELYQQFDLNKPWDDPHNRKLIEKMPAIFASPGVRAEPGMTHYQVLVGPGTMFEERMGFNPRAGARMADITDGTSNTLMIVEAAKPVIWTKPDDVAYDPQGRLPKLGGLYGAGFNAAFADGFVRYLENVADQTLHALISRSGGEVIQLPR